MPASSSKASTRRLPWGISKSPTPSTVSFGIVHPPLFTFSVRRRLRALNVDTLCPFQFAAGLRDVRFIEEGVAVADDGLWDQHLGLRRHAGRLLDRGADRHDLDVAAAHLVDVQLDADD